MQKTFAVITIFLLLLIGLTGCTTQQHNNNNNIITSKVELIDYTIRTQKHIAVDMDDWVTIADGFVYSDDAERYLINGTIKNIASSMLSKINITINFYDNNNNFLVSETRIINDLPNDNTSVFEISYWDTSPYFNEIDHLQFTITAS